MTVVPIRHNRRNTVSHPVVRNRQEAIRSRINQMEIAFKKKRSRNFLIGYPATILLMVASISLWILLTGVYLMPRLGGFLGFMAGCLIFLVLVTAIRLGYQRWNRNSVSRSRLRARKTFDEHFPSADKQARDLALEILKTDMATLSLAQALLGPTADTGHSSGNA